jgi:dihydroorotase
MGNLSKPIETGPEAIEYRDRIRSVGPDFEPLMTIMLTRRTTPEIVRDARCLGVKALKYIPDGVSTNSETGLSWQDLPIVYPAIEMAEKLGMPFLGHFESPLTQFGKPVREMFRERDAIRFLEVLVRRFPELKIVVEHATTQEMIEFVIAAPPRVAATLTAVHATISYSQVFGENEEIQNPDCYCKPVAKTMVDRDAVIKAMISGNPKFFAGTDSAPHPIEAKKGPKPPAGIFSAPVALPVYAKIFELNQALDRLENFVSRFGADFYDLPLNQGTIFLFRKSWKVPESGEGVNFFMGGETLDWQVATAAK